MSGSERRAPAPTVATIGVYGWTLERFLESLREAGVRQLLDVRQRRGVRGAQHAWANATRLEQAVWEAGIEYRHHPDLAPTTELRELQYREDAKAGVGKRSRIELAPDYRERYTREILDHVDLGAIVRDMPDDGGSSLMCVERDPQACHRSLIAERMATEHGVTVVHLRP
jgi:uncharacterized protein (DUF488 family)